MSDKLLDTTYKEWLNYYNVKCRLECNDGKHCPYKIGHCCLGDILHEEDDSTLRKVLIEVEVIKDEN